MQTMRIGCFRLSTSFGGSFFKIYCRLSAISVGGAANVQCGGLPSLRARGFSPRILVLSVGWPVAREARTLGRRSPQSGIVSGKQLAASNSALRPAIANSSRPFRLAASAFANAAASPAFSRCYPLPTK
jgi:hypothetical protein